MSDCGGILVACLAAPLVLVVLLVAGVAYAALQGAQLVGSLAIQLIDFVGPRLVEGIKTATGALQNVGSAVAERLGNTLADSAATLDSLRVGAVNAFESKVQDFRESRKVATATERAALTGVARARSLHEALSANTCIKLVAEQHAFPALQRAETLMASADVALTSNDLQSACDLSEEAESLIADVTHMAHSRLVQAERAVVTAQAGTALTDMGYEVSVAQDLDCVGVVGRKGEHVVAMSIQPGGNLCFDMAGFLGSQCEEETDQLLRRLEENGLKLGGIDVNRHGCAAGGSLIKRAQATGLPLEEALSQLVSNAPSLDTQPVRRPTRLASKDETARTSVAWVWGRHLQGLGGKL